MEGSNANKKETAHRKKGENANLKKGKRKGPEFSQAARFSVSDIQM